jgi:hypothetical protein
VKDFFRNLNFPRWIITVMLLASAVLGYFVWQRGARLDEVQLELSRAAKLVTSIQELAMQLDALQDLKAKQLFTAQDDPEQYIRDIAKDDKVKVGQVDITPSERESGKGIVDKKFRIKSSNKNARFARSQIGNFLYQLEAKSRLMRVTSLKIQPVEKLKPGEIGNDTWAFETEITSRVTQ